MKPSPEAVSGGTQEGLEAAAAPPRSLERVHELKCWPQYFDLILSGAKTFEARWNDRQFRVGDVLRLREWIRTPESDGGARDTPIEFPGIYTGRETRRTVTYILESDAFGIAPGWAILALAPGNATPKEAPPSPDSPSQGERKQQLLGGPAALLKYARDGLWKAQIRIGILLDRMRGCDAEVKDGTRGDTTGHELSLFEGDGWIEEHRGQLAKLDAVLAGGLELCPGCDCVRGRCHCAGCPDASDKPAAGPSSSSSASLESGGGTLDTMGAATRDPTNPSRTLSGQAHVKLRCAYVATFGAACVLPAEHPGPHLFESAIDG